MSIKTIKVSNVSLGATERDIKEFFSLSGDIDIVEMQSDNEQSQIAYVTFKDSQGPETAVLLSATKKIADAKLAKDFQAVLKEFQKAQQLATERETAYTPFVPQTVLPSRYCMESLPHIRFYSYRNVAILLMLFVGFGIQVGSGEPYSNFNNSNINVFCSSKNYVMTSYFQNYENLHDSNFQDFITHELQTGLCEVLPDNSNLVIRQSVLQRHLIGEGYHRHLSSSIRFHIDPEPFSQLPFRQCEVIVVERLPSGVFADPFELQHLHSHGVFTDVAVFGDTNLELPSFRSNQSAVEIHMNVGSDIFLRQKNGLEFKVQLPLHARYQPLDETGHSRVEFGDPDLFMRCCKEGKLQNRSCLFISTSNNVEPKTVHAVWRIPSGIKAHAGVVSVVTFISAFLSTILIVLTSIFCSVKSLKQTHNY